MLAPHSLTEFQRRVLIEACRIPRGKTATYGDIAKRLGRPRACRAVGRALARNPLPVRIPCHRVIRSDGGVGNYSAGGARRKLALLRKEGWRR